ncbi:MAG: PspC domain-containing protein [Caldilineaceae bacterium]
MPTKRLTRSSNDKMIAGVCGGLANYFNIDPTLVRLGFVALLLLGMGSPVLAYLVLWLLMPLDEDVSATPQQTLSSNFKEMTNKAREVTGQVKQQVNAFKRNDATQGPGDQI